MIFHRKVHLPKDQVKYEMSSWNTQPDQRDCFLRRHPPCRVLRQDNRIEAKRTVFVRLLPLLTSAWVKHPHSFRCRNITCYEFKSMTAHAAGWLNSVVCGACSMNSKQEQLNYPSLEQEPCWHRPVTIHHSSCTFSLLSLQLLDMQMSPPISEVGSFVTVLKRQRVSAS